MTRIGHQINNLQPAVTAETSKTTAKDSQETIIKQGKTVLVNDVKLNDVVKPKYARYHYSGYHGFKQMEEGLVTGTLKDGDYVDIDVNDPDSGVKMTISFKIVGGKAVYC